MGKGMQNGKDVTQQLEQYHERNPEQVEIDAAAGDAEWCMELARRNAWTVHNLMMASSRTQSREGADELERMPRDCGVPTEKVEETWEKITVKFPVKFTVRFTTNLFINNIT